MKPTVFNKEIASWIDLDSCKAEVVLWSKILLFLSFHSNYQTIIMMPTLLLFSLAAPKHRRALNQLIGPCSCYMTWKPGKLN
jgi:hypothetical protein